MLMCKSRHKELRMMPPPDSTALRVLSEPVMNPYKENKAMVKIQYIGHATLLIETDVKIIIDPYLKGKGRIRKV